MSLTRLPKARTAKNVTTLGTAVTIGFTALALPVHEVHNVTHLQNLPKKLFEIVG